MRKLIEKASDALYQQEEKKEERIAQLLDRHVDAMADRLTLKKYIYVLSGINFVLWACVMIFPYDIYKAFETVGNIDDRIVLTVVAIIFGIGMWLTYALFRLRFPELEDRGLGNDFLSSVAHQQGSYRRFHVWLASVAGGVLNLLALFIVELLRVESWRSP
ncbi:MAG: hypothetical protein IPL32_02355 [Chloracidobacterium sp.]|nr:hypothetical protein [Chloracidobacterium sp.]